jgi:hypothetical protein
MFEIYPHNPFFSFLFIFSKKKKKRKEKSRHIPQTTTPLSIDSVKHSTKDPGLVSELMIFQQQSQ